MYGKAELHCNEPPFILLQLFQVLTALANIGLEHRYTCDYDLLTMSHWKVLANVKALD